MKTRASILIVDDDLKARETLSDLLTAKGHTTIVADTGKDAFEKVIKEPVSVALIDLECEDNLGIEVLKKIKDRFPEAECIVTTAHASLSSAVDAINHGAFAYVKKPYDIHRLLAKIERAIEKNTAFKELRENEERFRNAFENANDGVCLVDPSGRFIKVNQRMGDLLGYSCRELESKTVLDVTHPEDIGLSKKAIQQVASGKNDHLFFEKKYIHKQGHAVICLLSSSMFKNTEGTPLYFISHVHDISERKKIEYDLQQSKSEWENTFDAMSDWICMIDIKRRQILRTNAAGKKFLGKSFEDVVGQTCCKLIHGSENMIAECPLKKMIRSGKREELLLQSGERWLTAIVDPVKDEKGEIIGAVHVVRDVTEKKTAELEIENKTKELEEMNSALEVLLRKREKDKTDLEEKILSNIKNLIQPYLRKLQEITHNDQQATYLRLIESNFKDILSPLPFRLSSRFHRLTPTEIKIADLIKNEKTNKEIAQILNISVKTVEFHRSNIRHKLDIKNKKINLRSFLLSFS